MHAAFSDEEFCSPTTRSRVANSSLAGTASGFLVPSAHVRAGSLIAEFVDRRAVKPASECIAQGLGQALVLVVVRLNLAIAVAPLTLLRVRVHLEVQRATEDLT